MAPSFKAAANFKQSFHPTSYSGPVTIRGSEGSLGGVQKWLRDANIVGCPGIDCWSRQREIESVRQGARHLCWCLIQIFPCGFIGCSDPPMRAPRS